jgi:hypothetical protein
MSLVTLALVVFQTSSHTTSPVKIEKDAFRLGDASVKNFTSR